MNYESVLKKSLAQIRQDQKICYRQDIPMVGTVAANSTQKVTVGVSNYGDFFLQKMTGKFECLYNNSGSIVDTGICYLYGKFADNSNNRDLFDSFVSFDLFLTPGHCKSMRDTNFLTTQNPRNLFFPESFEYCFAVNGDIGMEVRNTSNVELSFEILFQGYRIKDQKPKG